MDLDWLKDFLALAEQKNFSRAAEARNVTQPAFSRRIRALEDWIGTPLFVRGGQGAVLTPAGTHFQPLAMGLARDLEQARRGTRAAGDQETTELSIAATHAISFTFFPGWIRRHMSFEALGALSLSSDNLQGCEQIMQSGEVHFLLCHYHPEAPMRFDLERNPSLQVGHDVLIPLCAPDADGSPLWPIPGRDIKPTRHLAYSQASGLGRILATHPAAQRQAVHMETVITSHLAATLMTMAREGQGFAWLPRILAEEELSRRRLVRAGPEEFDIAIEVRLFRSNSRRNRIADKLWNDLSSNKGD